MITRGVEAFLKKTAIAYHQNPVLLLGFGGYAITAFFKNASTSRVHLPVGHMHNKRMHPWPWVTVGGSGGILGFGNLERNQHHAFFSPHIPHEEDTEKISYPVAAL